ATARSPRWSMLALTNQSPRLSHERCGERSPAACRPGGDRMELERVNPPSLGRTGRIVGDYVVRQFDQALANLLEALRAAGGSPEHLASLTVYAVDLDDYRAHSRELGTAWRRLAGRDCPAMAAIGVARLWDPAALVEIQGCAVVP